MKNTAAIVLAFAVALPLSAAPAKHAAHKAARHDAQFDAAVAAGVADMKGLQDQVDDGQAMIDAHLRGDAEGEAEARLRRERRECQNHDMYMQAYDAASPGERQVLHERCYGSRGK